MIVDITTMKLETVLIEAHALSDNLVKSLGKSSGLWSKESCVT